MITQFFKVCENKKNNRFLPARVAARSFCASGKRSTLFFILWLALSFSFANAPVNVQQGASVKTLVIDPGHGGTDPGAIGLRGNYEARLALAISLKFGALVEKYFPDVKVVYTRKTDTFVTLKDRAEMANKVKADLFFCIHLNSSTNREAYGTSTYVLGLHRTEANLEVAKRENAVIELEEGGASNYDFDPNSPEGHIIMSMKQNAFLDQSLKVAAAIETEQASFAQRKSRGVKQAGFWVLYKTAMPSILTEIGFVSNPSEEDFLASETGQKTVAASLFRGFVNYKNEIENRKDSIDLSAYLKGVATEKPQPSAPKEDVAKRIEPVQDTIAKAPAPKPEKIVEKKPNEITQYVPDTIKPATPPVKTETPKTDLPKAEQQKTPSTIYHIQISAGLAPPKNVADIYVKFGDIYTEKIPNSNVIRYMVGSFTSSVDAYNELIRVRTSGIPDAFVVRYENGVRMK